ncbi:MAG: hypothetical protein KUG73_07225 [Pseudomonadales bacterium]|nr:hypothetical protein [Pseudomonadales bacterium]
MPNASPGYPPEVFAQPASYCVLKLLEGTWINDSPGNNATGWGLNTTYMSFSGSSLDIIPVGTEHLSNTF